MSEQKGKKPTRAERNHEKLAAERDKPTRTEEQLTVDIIDSIATLCQLLKGRNLGTPDALDALEDLVDNAEVGKLFLEVFKNEHGRRKIDLK